MLLILVLYGLFGSSFVFGKILLEYASPLFITGVRFSLGGLILLAYQYWHPKQQFKFKLKHVWWYAQMVVLGILVTYVLRFWALHDMPAAKTNFLYNLSPFMSSLLSYFIFGEKMSNRKWLGLFIGCAGLIPVLVSSSAGEDAVGGLTFLSWPEIAIIVSVATHTYSWIIMRKLVKEKSYSPMMVNGISMTVGGLLALLLSFITEGFNPIASANIAKFSITLAAIIIISNIICYNLYGYLLKKHTATFLSFAGFLGPLFTAIYGWILLGETVTWHFYLSTIIVFIGLYLFYQEELQDRTKEFDVEI